MTQITPFSNGEFDLPIIADGDSFRVLAPQLAHALGFRDAFRLVESIPEEEKGYTTACTPGGEQRVGYVTEAGFYRALGQRQPARITDPTVRAQVERFQSWVYAEVLPAIRKTGGYQVARPAELPQSYAEALRAFADEVEARQLAEVRVAALEPSAAAWDAMGAAAGDFSVAEAAQQLARAGHEVGRQRLFEWLAAHRWIYRVVGRRPHWLPRQEKVDAGLLALKSQGTFLNERTGETEVAPPTIRVTPAGLRRLNREFADERLDGVA